MFTLKTRRPFKLLLLVAVSLLALPASAIKDSSEGTVANQPSVAVRSGAKIDNGASTPLRGAAVAGDAAGRPVPRGEVSNSSTASPVLLASADLGMGNARFDALGSEAVDVTEGPLRDRSFTWSALLSTVALIAFFFFRRST